MDKDDLEMMKIPSSLEKQALNKKAFTSGSFFVFAQLLARGIYNNVSMPLEKPGCRKTRF